MKTIFRFFDRIGKLFLYPSCRQVGSWCLKYIKSDESFFIGVHVGDTSSVSREYITEEKTRKLIRSCARVLDYSASPSTAALLNYARLHFIGIC